MLGDVIRRLLGSFGIQPVITASASPTVTPQERAILHAKDGYKNAQEVIKLIDAKSTLLAGTTVLLLGFTLQLLKQYFELPAELKAQLQHAADGRPYAFLLMNVIAMLSMLSGVLSLWSSIFSLVGRTPKLDDQHFETILFPYYKGKPAEHPVCEKIVTGISEEELAREYVCQIWNVGRILYYKLRRNRLAAWMFLGQIGLLTIGGLVLLYCFRQW